jgi:hypothetical protein
MLRVIGGVSGGSLGRSKMVETSDCDRDRNHDPNFSELIDYPERY